MYFIRDFTPQNWSSTLKPLMSYMQYTPSYFFFFVVSVIKRISLRSIVRSLGYDINLRKTPLYYSFYWNDVLDLVKEMYRHSWFVFLNITMTTISYLVTHTRPTLYNSLCLLYVVLVNLPCYLFTDI